MFAWIAARVVLAGADVDAACLRRSCASVSTGAPGIAGSGFVAVCQPGTGVVMTLIEPAGAAMLPGDAQTAVTSIAPEKGITTLDGRDHAFLFTSDKNPPII